MSLNTLQPRFDHGYTGQEQMSGFGLINYNGRLYNPYLQMFISPDPTVPDPSNPLSYNRFTYCMNNPLRYVDPSGLNNINIDAVWCTLRLTSDLSDGIGISGNGGSGDGGLYFI